MQENWIDAALDSLATRMTAAGRSPLGYRASGRPIWPIFGGAEDGDGGGSGGAEGGDGGGAGGGAGAGAESGDGSESFPAGTAVDDMTPQQQAAYWKDKARKHEERNKSIGNLTAAQLKDLQEKAKRADQLEHDLMSDKDKAVAEAKEAARTEAIAEATPRLVRAEFKAAGKGVLTTEQINSLLEDLDTSKYVTSTGDVDEDKVSKKVAAFAPARGSSKLGPSSGGTGSRQTATPGSAADKGRAEAQKRFGTKSA